MTVDYKQIWGILRAQLQVDLKKKGLFLLRPFIREILDVMDRIEEDEIAIARQYGTNLLP